MKKKGLNIIDDVVELSLSSWRLQLLYNSDHLVPKGYEVHKQVENDIKLLISHISLFAHF
jgi:hypothetical protein